MGDASLFFLQYEPPVELDEFYNLCFYNPNMSLLHAKICYCWPCGFKKIELEKKLTDDGRRTTIDGHMSP